MRLTKDIYELRAIELAPKFLGMELCRRLLSGEVIRQKITETEIYCGEDDTACHAHKGKTKRTSIMYESGGFAYIYLCYGIHNLLNIVTGIKDFPEAVLIRGTEDFNGPGKLTKAMSINMDLNKENLTISDRLWIEDVGIKCKYTKEKRVGIAYADQADQDRLWRFTAKEFTK